MEITNCDQSDIRQYTNEEQEFYVKRQAILQKWEEFNELLEMGIKENILPNPRTTYSNSQLEIFSLDSNSLLENINLQLQEK